MSSIPGVGELLALVGKLNQDAKEHLEMKRVRMGAPHCPAHESFEYSCGECLAEADKRI